MTSISPDRAPRPKATNRSSIVSTWQLEKPSVCFNQSNGYEALEAMLDDRGDRLLLRRESPTEPPNYFIRTAQEVKPLTNIPRIPLRRLRGSRSNW